MHHSFFIKQSSFISSILLFGQRKLTPILNFRVSYYYSKFTNIKTINNNNIYSKNNNYNFNNNNTNKLQTDFYCNQNKVGIVQTNNGHLSRWQ